MKTTTIYFPNKFYLLNYLRLSAVARTV